MLSIALLFVGAVLLVNGLLLRGVVSARSAAPINLLSGSLLAMAALHLALNVRPLDAMTEPALWVAAGYLLFAFTYLFVGLNALVGADDAGVGWYCLWAGLIAAILSTVQFAEFNDPRMGLLWASWCVLFSAFALALLGRWVWAAQAAGMLAIVQALTTATVPALMMLNGSWEDLSVPALATLQSLALVAYGYQAYGAGTRRSAANGQTSGHDLAEEVPENR